MGCCFLIEKQILHWKVFLSILVSNLSHFGLRTVSNENIISHILDRKVAFRAIIFYNYETIVTFWIENSLSCAKIFYNYEITCHVVHGKNSFCGTMMASTNEIIIIWHIFNFLIMKLFVKCQISWEAAFCVILSNDEIIIILIF